MNVFRFDQLVSRVQADFKTFQQLKFFQLLWEFHKAGLAVALLLGFFSLVGWKSMSGVTDSVGTPGEGAPLVMMLLILGFLVSAHLGLVAGSLNYAAYGFSDISSDLRGDDRVIRKVRSFQNALPCLRCSAASVVVIAVPMAFYFIAQGLIRVFEQILLGQSVDWSTVLIQQNNYPVTFEGYWVAEIMFLALVALYSLILRKEARLQVSK